MSADLVSHTAADTARMICDTGRQARSVCVDVTDARAVGEALARTEEELGRIDVVVNNAGITIVGGVKELSSEQWDRELDINLKSVYLVARGVAGAASGRWRLHPVHGVDRRPVGDP